MTSGPRGRGREQRPSVPAVDAGRSPSGVPRGFGTGSLHSSFLSPCGMGVCLGGVGIGEDTGRSFICPSWVLEGPREVSRAPCGTCITQGQEQRVVPEVGLPSIRPASLPCPGFPEFSSLVTLPAPQEDICYPKTRGDSLSRWRSDPALRLWRLEGFPSPTCQATAGQQGRTTALVLVRVLPAVVFPHDSCRKPFSQSPSGSLR